LKLALWPTVPAEEAVGRRRATSATRQRTIEANGIDCGASCSRSVPGCGDGRATRCSGCSFLSGAMRRASCRRSLVRLDAGSPCDPPGRSCVVAFRNYVSLSRSAGLLESCASARRRRAEAPSEARSYSLSRYSLRARPPDILAPVQLEALPAITGLLAQLVEAPRLLVHHRPPRPRRRGARAARSSKRLRTCSNSRARFLSAFSELAAPVFLRLTGTSRVARAA
jgi:hypothetical protein